MIAGAGSLTVAAASVSSLTHGQAATQRALTAMTTASAARRPVAMRATAGGQAVVAAGVGASPACASCVGSQVIGQRTALQRECQEDEEVVERHDEHRVRGER